MDDLEMISGCSLNPGGLSTIVFTFILKPETVRADDERFYGDETNSQIAQYVERHAELVVYTNNGIEGLYSVPVKCADHQIGRYKAYVQTELGEDPVYNAALILHDARIFQEFEPFRKVS